jgi:rod shape-determining protein MreC
MRNLINLIIRYYFFFLFLILEVASILLVVQNNTYHRAQFTSLARSVEGFFYETFGGFREYLVLRQTNRELQMENTLLRNRLDGLSRREGAYSAVSPESGPGRKFSYIPATIINSSTNKQYNFMTLDKGRHHGIEPEMAVVSPAGVVGVVYAVSANFSSVIPMINRDFRLSAKIRRNGYFGSLSWPGRGFNIAILEEIPYHVDLRAGDTIVTSGYSAIFPEGILVGTVSSFEEEEGNFYTIEVDITVDYKKVSHVNVIRNLLRDEQLELERITGND